MTLSDWSIRLATRCHLPAGDCFQRLYALLPWWLLASVIGLVLSLIAWFLLRRIVAPRWPGGGPRLAHWRESAMVVVFCAALVGLFDGAGFLHGFFRQDDFSFLQVTRDTPSLWGQMLLFHNDHGYPLYRLEVWLLVHAAGPQVDAAALATWFNAVNFLTCTAILTAACWLLHELGGSRGSLFALPVMLWFWPGWGEFTAGYYTLIAYLQVLAASLAATAALLRGFRLSTPRWQIASLILVAVAAGIDTSGMAIFPMLAAVGFAWTWSHGDAKRHCRFWLAFGALFVLGAVFYFGLGHHPYSARELVQNPRGTSLGLHALVANILARPLATAVTILSLPGGMALALVTPTFVQFAFVARTPPFAIVAAITVLELVASLGLALVAHAVWRRLSYTNRYIALALGINAVVGLGLVILARNAYATAVPVALWPSKFLAIPVGWTCLVLVWIVERVCLPWSSPCFARMAYIATVAGLWLTVSYRACERAMLPEPLAYVARGRWGNVQNAIVRAELYSSLMRDLAQIAKAQGSRRILLPDWRRWAPAFYERYGCLEWGCDYTPKGVTHLFWDFLAASPQLGLEGSYQSAEPFTPATIAHFARYRWLDGAFTTVSPTRPPASP